MHNILDENIIKELFKECLEHIQSGGLYAIPEILIFVSKIASKVDHDLLHEFLHLAKASVFDLRRNVQFWLAFSGECFNYFSVQIYKGIFCPTFKLTFISFFHLNFNFLCTISNILFFN